MWSSPVSFTMTVLRLTLPLAFEALFLSDLLSGEGTSLALRTELHMRMVMPTIVPHSEEWPYMAMARAETGPGGNPHTHGFCMRASLTSQHNLPRHTLERRPLLLHRSDVKLTTLICTKVWTGQRHPKGLNSDVCADTSFHVSLRIAARERATRARH